MDEIRTFLVSLVDFLEKYNGAVTAVATAFIAAFTIILARVTGKQARLTRESIDLAREEFISTHRPKLVVRQFQLNPAYPDQKITVQFSIINVGDTDAIPTHIGCEVALWNGRYFENPGIDAFVKPIDDCPLIVSGQRISSQAESRFVLSQSQHVSLAANKLTICVVGEITYMDRRGISRPDRLPPRPRSKRRAIYSLQESRTGIPRLKERRPVGTRIEGPFPISQVPHNRPN